MSLKFKKKKTHNDSRLGHHIGNFFGPGKAPALREHGGLESLMFRKADQKKHDHPGTPNNPVFYGCFNWMIPNHYIENGCFTKHPQKNSCLGYKDNIIISEFFQPICLNHHCHLGHRQVILASMR